MAGLLAKSMDSRPTVVAGSVAGVLSVVAVGLPLHTSLIVATLVGIAAGRVARPSRPRPLEPSSPEPTWDLPRPPREWVR
jgi:hypothetical protein